MAIPINDSNFDFINIISSAVIDQFTGGVRLAAVGGLIFIVLLLLVMGARREAVIIIPIPMILAMSLNSASLPDAFKITTVIMAWSYMAAVIFTMVKSR